MFKIHYLTPFALDKNLGAAYNFCMDKMIPHNDDYAAFSDGDTMFLGDNYGKQIYDIVAAHPEAGMFTCLTNRVGHPGQCYNGVISENPDIIHHKRIALSLQLKYKIKVIKIKTPISGILMIIQKKVWLKYKFKNGLLGVDNNISGRLQGAGYPVYLMRGVYMFHYYRLIEGHTSKRHLK